MQPANNIRASSAYMVVYSLINKDKKRLGMLQEHKELLRLVHYHGALEQMSQDRKCPCNGILQITSNQESTKS